MFSQHFSQLLATRHLKFVQTFPQWLSGTAPPKNQHTNSEPSCLSSSLPTMLCSPGSQHPRCSRNQPDTRYRHTHRHAMQSSHGFSLATLVYMKSMGLFLALWSGLHPCLYAVPGLSPSTLGPPGPPLLICGFWGFSLHSQMGAEIRPAPATMAVRCGFSKESTHKFKLRTNLFVFIASNNAMLTRFPVSQMLSKST